LNLRYPVRRFLIVTALALTVFALLPRSGAAYTNNYTHAILNEHFVAIYCPTCRADEPYVQQAYQDLSGSLIVVSYHIVQWSTEEGNQLALHYGAHTIPYHTIDGGYGSGKGKITSSVLQRTMDSAGERSVHRVSLAITKTVEGDLLGYEGSVQDLDGKPFNGDVQVFITENGLMADAVEWNHVFRAFGVKQTLILKPNGVAGFSGNWTIPSYANAEQLSVAAAVFDSSTTGTYGPYAIQAVDDAHSGQVIPETSRPDQIAAIAAVVALTSTLILKKRNQSLAD